MTPLFLHPKKSQLLLWYYTFPESTVMFVSQYFTTLNELELFYKLLTYITTCYGNVFPSKAGH